MDSVWYCKRKEPSDCRTFRTYCGSGNNHYKGELCKGCLWNGEGTISKAEAYRLITIENREREAGNVYPLEGDEEARKRKKSRRCFQRVMSGLERGGNLRFLTLTSSDDSPDNIQKSFKALYMRLKRRGVVEGYIKVPEYTRKGKLHLHILFRGSYIEQKLISKWWQQIHQASVVDIRMVKLHKGKRAIANYMAKYMCKDMAGRYSWSWGWVWRGFCRHWELWKKYWRNHFEVEGKTTFRNCLIGWQMWLHGAYIVDVAGMEADLPPPLVMKLNVRVDVGNPGQYMSEKEKPTARS